MGTSRLIIPERGVWPRRVDEADDNGDEQPVRWPASTAAMEGRRCRIGTWESMGGDGLPRHGQRRCTRHQNAEVTRMASASTGMAAGGQEVAVARGRDDDRE